MKRFFLALVCAAMVFLGASNALFGCSGPLRQFECRGGFSGAEDWHRVDADSLVGAHNGGEFGECRTVTKLVEHVVGSEYAAERSERWLCEGYVQSPLKYQPWNKTVITVRRGTMEFDVAGDEMLIGTITQSTVGGVGITQATTRATIQDDLTARFQWILVLDALKTFDTVRGPWGAIARNDKLKYVNVAHCWPSSNHLATPNMSMWPPDNSDDFPGPTCFDWSPSEAKFVEVTREGPRYICVKELQAYHLEENSEGVKERGTMFFPVRSQRHMCGPKTHAESGIEAALRNDAGKNYQLSGYGGECWEMGKPRPPNPATWSGHNGPW